MTVTLSQLAEAGHPDRPGHPPGERRGLRIACAPGVAGSYLPVDLAMSVVDWHVRLAVRQVDLVGRLAILRLLDSDGRTIVELTADGDAGGLQATFADGSTLEAACYAEPAWHVIEVGFDAGANRATLQRDGVAIGELTSVVLQPLASVWLGGVWRSPQAAGAIDVDELIIADQSIGPIVVEPTDAFADEPVRWLVIYNTADAGSRTWAATYAAEHDMPLANLLGLDLPADETIDEPAFTTLRAAVDDYLQRHGMAEQIVGVLCGHGVPGAFTDAGGTVHSVADQLRKRQGGDLAPMANPAANPTQLPERAALLDPTLPRLAARIDGPTVADSLALTSRAKQLAAQPIGEAAMLMVDTETEVPVLVNQREALRQWVGSLRQQALRLPPMTTDEAPDGTFAAAEGEALLFTFDPSVPPADFFVGDGAGRVFGMHLQVSEAAWDSLRAADDGWVRAALAAGYAATAGAVGPTSVSALPHLPTLVDALAAGWTLAEAWAAATEWVGLGMTLIGDPLTTVSFPKRGWDVCGPFIDLADVRFDKPVAHLRFDQTALTLPAEARPVEGDNAWFAVVPVDEAGRRQTGWHALRVQASHGTAVLCPSLPAWPAKVGWRPRRVGDAWWIDVIHGLPFGRAGVTQVDLERQTQGAQPTAVAKRPVSARASRAVLQGSVTPNMTERFRVVLTGANGATVASPWSAWLTAEQPEPAEVVLL